MPKYKVTIRQLTNDQSQYSGDDIYEQIIDDLDIPKVVIYLNRESIDKVATDTQTAADSRASASIDSSRQAAR